MAVQRPIPLLLVRALWVFWVFAPWITEHSLGHVAAGQETRLSPRLTAQLCSSLGCNTVSLLAVDIAPDGMPCLGGKALSGCAPRQCTATG